MRTLVVIGGGGHGRVVASAALEAGFHVLGVYDDTIEPVSDWFRGIPVLGPIADFFGAPHCGAVVAIGDNLARRALVAGGDRVGVRWQTVIHPSVIIDPTAKIGDGTVVCAGAILCPNAAIGDHVILNTACSVDHDGVVEGFAQLAPGVRLAGSVSVREGAFIGIGACVREGTRIGPWSTVGAGAVVVADVDAETMVVGVPAKPKAKLGRS